MDKKRIVKLKGSQGLAKRTDFPDNFNDLIEKANGFMPLEEPNKRYQFIDEKTNKEIKNQEDFEKMSKEYEKESLTKILINIVTQENILEQTSKNEAPPIGIQGKMSEIIFTPSTNETFDGNKKEETEDEKMKEDIKNLVKNKMKDLEDNIIKDIYQSIKTQLTSISQIQNNKINENNDNVIHQGIKCSNCGMTEIKGVRYKCSQCENFNLCENCESTVEHDINHIMIKIRIPISTESDLTSKINPKIAYKNEGYNYSVGPLEFKFKKDFDSLSQQVTLTNTGKEAWKSGNKFVCLKESAIKGEDCCLGFKVNPGGTAHLEIIFQNFNKEQITSSEDYFVYYQMFNSSDEAFGDVTKFKLKFE